MKPRLYTLFLTLVLVTSAIVAFGPFGILVAAGFLAAAEFLRSAKSSRQLIDRIVILILALVVLALLAPPIEEARVAARRSTCMNQLRILSLALRAYHDDYDCFPPAYIADKDGKPMHSWRVLILPYIGRRDLYQQYDFREPWNGPHNRKAASSRPGEFVCPSDDGAYRSDQPTTSYVAVVGPNTAWPGATTTKLSDFSHAGANSILLVEAADSGINWIEPRDITLDEACRGVNKAARPGISSTHSSDSDRLSSPKKVAIAAFADGRVHFLPEDLSPDDLKSMLTRTSEKAIYLDRHLPEQFGPLEWSAIAAILTATVLLLVRRRKR